MLGVAQPKLVLHSLKLRRRFNTMASPPKVAADDDFGGWSSAAPAPAANATPGTGKPAGGFSSGGEDLFSNVWE
ncbi:hypothetical protein EYC80_009434 [Monilinia laxa]|uniref:Uncharacterized protein n=1 Tax=Monilinia laxa TaxID=61186 RepID=A0A5N6JXS6_MONLA|nr:hypothetical protein EYC80_009434 [Monilinia laxa]